jgi:hypothetical protein
VALRGGRRHPSFNGVDFLSHFGFLVDFQHNRPLEGVTSLSLPTQAGSLPIPASRSLMAASRSTAYSPNSRTSLAPLGSSVKYATIPSIIIGL